MCARGRRARDVPRRTQTCVNASVPRSTTAPSLISRRSRAVTTAVSPNTRTTGVLQLRGDVIPVAGGEELEERAFTAGFAARSHLRERFVQDLLKDRSPRRQQPLDPQALQAQDLVSRRALRGRQHQCQADDRYQAHKNRRSMPCAVPKTRRRGER